MKYIAKIGARKYKLEFSDNNGTVSLEDKPVPVDLVSLGSDHIYSLIIDHACYQLHIEPGADGYHMILGHKKLLVEVEDERHRLIRRLIKSPEKAAGQMEVKAPMPGLIVRLNVEEGQEVKPGDSLLIIEAMKMENEIRSKTAGVIKKLYKAEKDSVDKDSPLLLIE
ncbi:acetyl-CoA carboxylase biotin carboxyl carrier protein subunit [bacterium]|nr:acetyl-CoA carboxylase biotin carboxyl carrier protein subunit [bacterium]